MNKSIKRPFLKWAGGKARLSALIRSHLPAKKTLVEPFVGAGAIFLNTDYSHYRLNDINPDLISVFTLLKKHGTRFIDDAAHYFTSKYNTEAAYYRLRQTFNESDDPYLRAQLFIYLNRHGYNGLCRYNQSGGFNVPFGTYKKPYFPRTPLEQFCRHAKRASFSCQDFSTLLQEATPDQVIYCDPPYVPLSSTANFVNYAQTAFDLDAQHRLAEQVKHAHARGVALVISNHDTPFTRELYSGAKFVSFNVPRLISQNAQDRQAVPEILALFL